MERIIFFNVSWMGLYDGSSDDVMENGGKFVKEHGFGGEYYNFQNSAGKVYGYVMRASGTVDLSRIYGDAVDDDVLNDVTVVFTATPSSGGRRVVGWYRHAKVHSSYQNYINKDRKIKVSAEEWGSNDKQVGYYAEAEAENAVCLPIDERNDERLFIPHGKDGAGNDPVWYADKERGRLYSRELLSFINEYEIKEARRKNKEEIRRRNSIEHRKTVETKAVETVIQYYQKRGYKCKSVESENKGWDLEVRKGKEKLYVEVKGLSGSEISVDLTCNEYKHMHKNSRYRLAVVTDCLKEPTLNIFAYIEEKDAWYDQYKNRLNIEEKISAKCSVID